MLDTNEFIGALGVVKNPASESLFNTLLKVFPKHTLHIPRMIIDELRRNLPPIVFAEIIKTIQLLTTIDENEEKTCSIIGLRQNALSSVILL